MVRQKWGLVLLALAVGYAFLAPQEARAQAVVISSSQRIDLSGTFLPIPNTSPPEFFLVESGFVDIDSHTTFSDSGNVEVQSHFHIHAVGQAADGTRYVDNEVTNDSTTINDPLPFVVSEEVNSHVIGQGPADDFFLHITLHITVNANGTTTAEVSNINTGP